MAIRIIIILFLLLNSLKPACNGFNWYHEININDCNEGDIATLKEFIKNSNDNLQIDMDINLNGIIDATELGWQLWEEGRLIHWICKDVPSPWYFYEYDCGLSGNIPNNINNLDQIIKLKIHNNELSGYIPNTICDLEIINKNKYWFNIDGNNLCPPYPDCLNHKKIDQKTADCK